MSDRDLLLTSSWPQMSHALLVLPRLSDWWERHDFDLGVRNGLPARYRGQPISLSMMRVRDLLWMLQTCVQAYADASGAASEVGPR